MNLESLCISDLNTVITCEKLTVVADGSGGQMASQGTKAIWTFYFQFFAAVEWASPRKIVVADRLQTILACKVATHWDARFLNMKDCRLRVVGSNELLDIQGSQNYKQRNVWALVDAEKGSGQ